MLRSQINQYLEDFMAALKKHQFYLPSFAHYSPNDWQNQPKGVINYVRQNQLGWDITDFNGGDFNIMGLSLFTLRNNNLTNLPPYAEKIIYVQKGQVTPMHYHKHKIEDIINRGGGRLVIAFYHSYEQRLDEDKKLDIYKDHRQISLSPGGKISLNPGESVRIPTYIYHSFWAEDAPVLAGEVSMTNDDNSDNIFLHPLGRFSQIIEDCPPIRLLCNEYERKIT